VLVMSEEVQLFLSSLRSVAVDGVCRRCGGPTWRSGARDHCRECGHDQQACSSSEIIGRLSA
jgi:hypothetical protein